MQASDSRPERIPQEGHQQPQLKFLNRYVRASVGMKWDDLGIELLDSNDIGELNTIEAENSSNLNKCCTKMFNLWLNKQPTASWNQLIKALRQPCIALGTLASNIEQMLLQVPTNQSEETDMHLDARQNGKSSQVEQTNVPTSQPVVTVMQSDDSQPREDDKSSQVQHTNVTNEAVESVEVTKSFTDILVMKLRRKYSEVIMTLIQIFNEKKVDIERLITTLSFDDVENKSIFSTDTAFSAITTENQLLHHVAKYCKSIYDYRVLDILVQASNCPEAVKELTEFTELRQNSILKEIDLMSEHGELLHPDDFMPGTYKFIIEYVGGKCTTETIEMVKGIVEQSVRLKKGILIFKGLGVESILFIFQISEAVKDYLLQYKFTEQDIRFLEGNNIISLTVVDRVGIMSSSQPREERELQSQEVRLEVSKQISLLESKADEDLETIGKLKRELKDEKSKSSDYQIRLNQTEDQLSEKSSELKMYQEELAKLKSDYGKLVEEMEQLMKKSLEERELQIQEVRLELTKQISSLESKADETIGKLKRELKDEKSKSSDYKFRLNQTEDKLSKKCSELKMYQEEQDKLKSNNSKLVNKVVELKKKSSEVQQKPAIAESRSSSLQEESFELQTQLDLLQAENVLVDQHKEKERCDIALQTDKVIGEYSVWDDLIKETTEDFSSDKIKMAVYKEENGVSTDKPHIILYPKRKFSEGRYGRVYAATYYGTECIAKEMPHFEEKTEHLLNNDLKKEIEMIQQLKHPNIIELFDVCRRKDSSNLPIFIMSKMFMTLSTFLEKYPNESFLYHKICILHNITYGLHYLHSKDFIHRNLTVDAIYLTEDLCARIVDFGLAKDIKQLKKKLSYSPGVLHHMPPEALHDNPKYTFKLDIFSFGCVVIQVIINKIPVPSVETYREQPEGSGQFIEITEVERRKDYIKKITDRKLHELHKIVKKCLQNNPDDRPTTFNLLPEMQKCKETQTKTRESILAEKTKAELIGRIVEIDPEEQLSHRFGENCNVVESYSEKKENLTKGIEEWRQYLKENQHDVAVKLSGVVNTILYKIRVDITDSEYLDAMAISSPVDKVARVIDIIYTRRREVCKKFCHILKEVKFEELSQPLLKLLD